MKVVSVQYHGASFDDFEVDAASFSSIFTSRKFVAESEMTIEKDATTRL
jgi:hypothetical protein